MSQIKFPTIEGKHRIFLEFKNDKAEDKDLFMFSTIALDK
jgi:hypothetical protein